MTDYEVKGHYPTKGGHFHDFKMNEHHWDMLLDDLVGPIDCPGGNGLVVPIIGAELLETCKTPIPATVRQDTLITQVDKWYSAWREQRKKSDSPQHFLSAVAPEFDTLLSAWQEATVDEPAPMRFMDRLAVPLQQWFAAFAPSLNVQLGSSIAEQVVMARLHNFSGLGKALVAALTTATKDMKEKGELAAVQERLRRLAEIREFPYFITTTPDRVFEETLGVAKEDRRVATRNGPIIDLPEEWHPSSQTAALRRRVKLFYLFGRIDDGGECDITDADKIESLVHLLADRRPGKLLEHLKDAHLLFIGTRFPDWLWLAAVRALRGSAFGPIHRLRPEIMAEAEVSSNSTLIGFLRAFSKNTRIYHPGGAKKFVTELHERWEDRKRKQKRRPLPLPPPPPPRPHSGPTVFISYTRLNKVQAESFHKQLEESEIPVWRDVRHLRGGSVFPAEIKVAIRNCGLFVALLSHRTIKKRIGWFRREWEQAKEQRKDCGPGVPFIVPIVIDDSDLDAAAGSSRNPRRIRPSHAADLQEYFENLQTLQAPDGRLSEADLRSFVETYRMAIRIRRLRS